MNFIARFFRRFVDAIKKVFDGNKKYQQYVYDAEKLLGAFERAIKADGNKKISGVAETRTAIARTTDNKRFVVTDRDILDGVEESKWRKVISDNLKEKYPDGIILGKNQVSVNQTSRKEMTYSDYATWLAKHSPEIFGDKLRATDNADEILTVASNWISEGLNHPRKDKIKFCER